MTFGLPQTQQPLVDDAAAYGKQAREAILVLETRVSTEAQAARPAHPGTTAQGHKGTTSANRSKPVFSLQVGSVPLCLLRPCASAV